IASLSGEDSGADENLTKLRELERAADERRAAYEDAVRAAQAGDTNLARVISPAEPPLSSTRPSAPQLSLAGALGGLLAGLGFAGWRRTSERDETADADDTAFHDLPENEYSDADWGADYDCAHEAPF